MVEALDAHYAKNAQKDITLFASTLTGLGTDLLGVTIPGPVATCPDGGTIWSQHGQSYTQFVSFDGQSRAMMPPGNSELAESGWFDNQQADWLAGSLNPASVGADVPVDAILDYALTYEAQ